MNPRTLPGSLPSIYTHHLPSRRLSPIAFPYMRVRANYINRTPCESLLSRRFRSAHHGTLRTSSLRMIYDRGSSRAMSIKPAIPLSRKTSRVARLRARRATAIKSTKTHRGHRTRLLVAEERIGHEITIIAREFIETARRKTFGELLGTNDKHSAYISLGRREEGQARGLAERKYPRVRRSAGVSSRRLVAREKRRDNASSREQAER